jgi:hypothetical protein
MKKPEVHSNAPIIPPCPASKCTGEGQNPTFRVKWKVAVPSNSRLLCKGDYSTWGGGVTHSPILGWPNSVCARGPQGWQGQYSPQRLPLSETEASMSPCRHALQTQEMHTQCVSMNKVYNGECNTCTRHCVLHCLFHWQHGL